MALTKKETKIFKGKEEKATTCYDLKEIADDIVIRFCGGGSHVGC